jgi:arylsulfatase
MKGPPFEGGYRAPAIAWWPGKIKAGSVNMDMFSHMNWWPTLARTAGFEAPPREWKDNEGQPIIFDGIDQSDSLLSKGPGKRETFLYFNDQSFGGVRVEHPIYTQAMFVLDLEGFRHEFFWNSVVIQLFEASRVCGAGFPA